MRRKDDIRLDQRDDAEDRQKAYNKLTVAQKIAKLDDRLGFDVGAKKERERLANMK